MFNNFTKYKFENLGYIKMPKINIPDQDYNRLKLKGQDTKEYLRALAREGFREKRASGLIPKDREKEYGERAKIELETFENLSFCDYVCMIYDIVRFCKSNGSLNSPARGSCGGSLVFWLIGVIGIDPIKHDLMFSRFISATRADKKEVNGEILLGSSSLPDVDLDSLNSFKDNVRKYLDDNYKNRTASIMTLSCFTGKILIKECLKVIEGSSEEAAKVGSDLLEKTFGNVENIKHAIEKNDKFKLWAKDHNESILVAQQLQDLIRNKSVHASGVLVCESEILDIMPMELSSDKRPTTSFDMNYAQKFGIKIDNLGVRTLDIVKKVSESANIKMEDIDVNHPSIYAFLKAHSSYYGLFQISDGLGKDTVKKVSPDNIEEIIMCISLGRPGCMKYIDDFVEYKKTGKKKNVDKRVEHLFSGGNILAFQEQLMKISILMAGFSESESDKLRKIIGKKRKEEMPLYKEKFINGSIKNGYDQKFAEETWQTFEDSGNYLFNRSHGCGYSYLTAITVYLKANYPIHFFKACLEMAQYEQDPLGEISTIQKELAHFNIKLLPPDLMKSDTNFKIEGDDIRYGLSSIKGISESTIEKLNIFRKEYSNKFEAFQAAKNAGLNIGQLSALIQAGALQYPNETRSRTVYDAQIFNILTDKEKSLCLQFGNNFNYNVQSTIKFLIDNKNEKGKPYINEKRFNTIKEKSQDYKEIYLSNKSHEELSCWHYENLLLGFSYSQRLYDIFSKKGEIPNFKTINECIDAKQKTKCSFVGQIKEAKSGTSKEKKTKYYKMVILDEEASITCMLFSEKITDSKEENNNKLPEEGDIVFVKGVKFGDAIFADTVTIQTEIIYTKLSQLKD